MVDSWTLRHGADRMGSVVELECVTTLDLPAERVLRKAIEADLQTAVVIGYTQDGEFYFASTTADGGNVMWLTEQARHELLKVADQIRNG